MPLVGTILNVCAILAGVAVGLATRRDLAAQTQLNLRKILGVLTVWFSFRILWTGFNGSVGQVLRQATVMLVALMIGKLLGRLLRVQRSLNRLGQYAHRRLREPPSGGERFSAGFVACSIVYCGAPLAVLGALEEGLSGDARVLLIKAAMDGLAAIAFARAFGWSAALAALPVLAYQGSLTWLGQGLEPMLRQHALTDSIAVVLGFQVFSVSLVILELKRIDLSDYLPALIVAPWLTWWLR